MRLRTVVLILLLLGILFVLTDLAVANRDLLTQPVELWGGVRLPVGVMMLGFLVAGFLAAALIGISREVGRGLERWRDRRARKRQEEIEEEYSRGLLAALEGRESEALRHFRAVLERDSRHFNTLLQVGEVLRALGRVDEAIEFHTKAMNLKEGDTRPLYALCEDYEAKGQLEQAVAVLRRVLIIHKNSISAWRKLRDLFMKAGRWEDALKAHRQAIRYAPADTEADRQIGLGIRYEIAKAQLAEGRTREAVAALRKILRDAPRFIPAQVKLGEALRGAGQEQEALSVWKHGFEATGSPIFLTLIEEHHLSREQPLAAIETLKECAQRSERDTIPKFYLGKLYFRLEMLDDALAVLSSLEGRASYAPTLHYLLGRIHERRKHFARAAQEYRRVIREMELVQLEYRCQSCRASTMEWFDRCPECGQWGTIEIDFKEEISLDELGLAPAPVYTVD